MNTKTKKDDQRTLDNFFNCPPKTFKSRKNNTNKKSKLVKNRNVNSNKGDASQQFYIDVLKKKIREFSYVLFFCT